MKKSLLFLSAAVLMLASSCSGNKEKEIQDSLRIEALTADYNQAATFNDSLLLLMGEIYNGLDSINMQEGLLYNTSAGEGVNRRSEIRNNLSAIKERLASNRKLLSEMEARIKASGNQNSVLSKTIEQMKVRLEQQDQKIFSLENRLAVAKDSIAMLSNQVVETQQQVVEESAAKEAAMEAYEAAETQLNTVYYALGTNKELKQNGLLEKKFLGATKVLKGDFNESYFTKADKRTLREIQTRSKKVKIWTNMPADSYNIVENPDKTKTINIINPSEFWSLSPYLIIQVD